MGQFKPMVKMETTEPSVELKLKKGGKVEKKMQSGGLPTPALPARGGMAPAGAPAAPSLMARRRAMRAMPAAPGPAAPVGPASRMMKEGGESKAEHASEMKNFSKLEGELKSHEGKPASKAHKGLATGGVAKGQGGYKKGGRCYADGGIIKSVAGETRMVTGKVDKSPAKTGEVKLGNAGGFATGGVAKANAGGYKKGGSAKKAYATGGAVNNSGHPVAMPKKAPSKPVRITALSGTFKKGGKVCMAEGGDVQTNRETKGYKDYYKREAEENKAMRDAMNPINIFKNVADKVRDLGGVTTTQKETSKTVTPPAKKRGGSIKK